MIYSKSITARNAKGATVIKYKTPKGCGSHNIAGSHPAASITKIICQILLHITISLTLIYNNVTKEVLAVKKMVFMNNLSEGGC